MRYAMFYCMKDCEVLRAGLEKFDKDLEQVFKDNSVNCPGIKNFLSISPIGYNLATVYGCFDGCFELTGKPQHFIQKSINGGRTMTADNKKLIVQNVGEIADFDAVSLYPSAMSIMSGVPKGIHKTLTEKDCTPKNIFGYDVF